MFGKRSDHLSLTRKHAMGIFCIANGGGKGNEETRID